MKKFTRLLILMMALAVSGIVFAQSSVTATYTAGDLPTSYGSYDPTCSGVYSLTVTIPAGSWSISGVDVSYNMTAASGAWMSEQNSRLECVEGTTEAGFATGDGYGGTYSYSRTGLDIASGPSAGGDLTFVLQTFRTWGGSLCETTYNKVDDGTWTVTVHYGPPLGNLDGYVTSTSGLALADAFVTYEDMEARTDATGYYELMNLPTGMIDVTCSHPQYSTTTATVDIVSAATVSHDFVLGQPDIAVTPLIFDETLHPEEYLTTYLSLLNTGDGPADFFATVVYPPAMTAAAGTGEIDPAYLQAPAVQDDRALLTAGETAPWPKEIFDGSGRSTRSDLDIAIVTSSNSGSNDFGTLTTALLGLGINSVDVIYMEPLTTTAADLLAYDGVLFGLNTFFTVPTEPVGDMLADYIDAGGKLIMTSPLNATGYTNLPIAGRLATDGYYAVTTGSLNGATVSTGTFDADHPIMEGVSSYGGSLTISCNEAADAELVASYGGGAAFVATKTVTNPVVHVNSFVAATGYVTGDVPLVIYNAFNWLQSSGGAGGWLTLDDETGTVPPGGGSFNIGTNFNASGTVAGEVYTADIVLMTVPNVGTITIPVTMTIGGDPFPTVGGFEAVLTNPVTGEVSLSWDAARITLDYYKIYRDGVILTTVDANTLSYVDMLPAFGAYDYEIQPIFVEGDGAKVGPETVEWFEPTLCWNPANPQNTQWPNVEEDVMLQLENCGNGVLEFSFPDYAVRALLNDPDFVPNQTSYRAPVGEQVKGNDEQYNGMGNDVIRGAGGPDAFGYVWIDSDEPGGPVYNWMDISATGTVVTGLTDDNVVGPFPMSFDFPYYGEVKDQFWVNSNGSIGFTSTYIGLSNYAIPTGNTLVDFIAWFWDDMDPGGPNTTVYYEDFSNYLIVQFDHYNEYPDGSGNYVDAQMIIYKNGSVIINYDVVSGVDLGGNTIGMQSSNNSVGLQVAYNTAYVHDGLALYMGPPGDHFIVDVEPFYGTIAEGETADIVMTYSSEGYEEAGDYFEDLMVVTNEMPLGEWEIPNTMTIELPAMFDGLVTDCNDPDVRLSNVTITAVMVADPDISFTTETAENGTYMLYVDRSADYMVTASRAGYVSQTVTTYIDMALTLDFAMCEEPYPVSMVHADPNEADTQCLITWALPMGPYLIVYDDGTAEEYFAWVGPGGMSGVKFTPANYPAIVRGADIYVGDGSYPEDGNFLGTSMEIMVFDDDGTDGMPGTALDSTVVTVDNYGWVNVAGLHQTFVDGDFYIVYRQIGFAPNVAPVGIDQDIPTVYRSYVKANNGEWMASLYQDMMIRAIVSGVGDNVMSMSRATVEETKVFPGKLSPKKYIATCSPNIYPGVQGEGVYTTKVAEATTRDFENYIVARVSDFNTALPPGPTNGTLVPIANPTANMYNDVAFGGQPDGFYAYAVKAVYESDESEWVYSNVVAHGLDNMATFTISQCDGLSPEGAVLTLSGRDYPNQVLIEPVDATGIVVLDSVIDGVYDLTVAKDGYTTYVHNELYIFADYTETVVLVELMFPARKLMVEPMTSVANWRSPYTLFMDNEGFDEGTVFPPDGWQTTSFGQGWYHTDDGSSGSWFVPPGDGWYAVSNDDGAPSPNDGCCDYLIMPALDLSATDGLLVQFDAYLDGAYSQTGTVDYSMDNGATWAVAMDIPTATSWTTYQVDLDAVAGNENVLVAFHANDNGAWASGLAIDNVSAFWGTEPLGYEVSLDGGYVASTPADVTTYTYLNLQYGVTYEAEVRAVYSCGTSEPVFYTFTSNYLYPPRNLMDEYVYGTNEVPLFWNPPMTVAGPGPMISLPNVVIENDAVTSASVASKGAAPVSSTTSDDMPNYAFNPDFGENMAWIATPGGSYNMYTMDMTDYSTMVVGPSVPEIASGDFMNDDETTMYVAATWGDDFYTVDVTTGAGTFVAAFTGQTGGYGVNGMACDKSTNTMYVAMTDGGLTASQIGTLDVTTGIITPIGSPNSVAPGLIDIAIDGSGQMYGWCLVNNSSYMIDKADGTFVLLGDIGYDANYGQGGNWNADDDMIYLTAYNATAGSSELRVLDPVTGGTAFVSSLPESQMTAFGVPRVGGVNPGGTIPPGLLSFNVYRDGGFIAEVPYEGQTTEEWVTYVDNNLMPDCYSYEVTAVYDLADYGFPGEFGESSLEGPDEVCVIWGKDLPFCEDWSIGTFEHNDWMISGDNWVIGADVGNDAPSAQWNWDPDPGADYVSTLTSSPFNADMLTEGSVMLDFDLKLADRNMTGTEMMVVEVYDGFAWYTVATFDNAAGSFDFTNFQVDITTYAMGDVFQIRFSAQGVNSFDVISWNVDNICVYRECEAPYNLTGKYVWNSVDDLGAEVCWEAAIAPASAAWFYYDDETIEFVWGSESDWDADVAIKVEAADLVDFEGAAVTMYRAFVDSRLLGVGTVSVKVMQGENPDPSAPIYVEDVTSQFVVGDDWNEFTLATPVMIDYTQPLWLGLYFTGPAATYGPGITLDMGVSNPNGELYYEAGSWVTLAGAGIDNRAWLLRGYVTTTYSPNSVELGSSVQLPTSGLATAASIDPVSADVSLAEVDASRDLTVFNIYRKAAMDTDYELLTTVPYDPEVGEYCYYDDNVSIQEGYYYQVTALYESEMDVCESAPAMALDNPMDDFVYIFVTGIDNPDATTTNLYPNPATDFVTVSSTTAIEQITVINYVGQVVFTQELSGENSVTLNTGSYESGVYVVRIDTESGVVTKRVVITE